LKRWQEGGEVGLRGIKEAEKLGDERFLFWFYWRYAYHLKRQLVPE
jgi:hypothetical protein